MKTIEFKKYEKPQIVRIETKLAEKHGCGSQTFGPKVRDNIDDVQIEKLCAEHGSPLFVFSEKTIKEKYEKAYKAFDSRYPNVQFAWSYKTNYLKGICDIFHQMGSIAEVVSEFEYDKARKLGIPGNDIIFNGPYKPIPALEKAATEGAKIHIDSFDEISDLEKVAKKLNKKIKVGIRINLDAGIYPQWSRFGFNLESGQAMDAVKRIEVGNKLEIEGLHCHIGTFILDPEAYGRAVKKLLMFADEMKQQACFNLEYLDLGGGFASRNRLKGIYQPPEVIVPDVEAYAESICSTLLRHCTDGNYPKLYLESGRHLIDEAGYLITSVTSSRNLNIGKRGYIMDAGINLLYTSTWYNLNVELAKEASGLTEAAVLYGPLCMNIDVVEEHILLPRLDRGSRLVISPVGAYNVTQSMQFIHCRPAVVMVREDGTANLIKRKETLEDIEIAETYSAPLIDEETSCKKQSA